MTKTKKRDLGFTLIELMIVITIIGLLSGMILVGLGRVRSLGRDTRRLADLRQVQNGLELYFNARGTYPTYQGTGQWGNMVSALTGANIGITSISNDPLNSGNYVYQYSANSVTAPATSYTLRATLENGNNSALRDAPTGTQNGLACDHTAAPYYYCVIVSSS